MNELTLIKRNGGAYIDSREVSEYIGKQHKHLMRDIRGYIEIMEKIGRPNFGLSDFFIESSYINAQNKEMPCYLLSKMACELVANKLIGEKGILFTIAYVRRFNELEAAERAYIEAKAATPRLTVFNAAVRSVLSGFSQIYASPGEVLTFLRGAYKPFGIIIAPHGVSEGVMTATDIALLHGIRSNSGRPHSHAVSAIIEKLNIAPEHIEITPYGLVGISVRYDLSVFHAVGGWLAANCYPFHIPHLGIEYHIHYTPRLYPLGDCERADDDDGICFFD